MTVHAERLDLFNYLLIVNFVFVNAVGSICPVGVVRSWRKMTGFLADSLEELVRRDWRMSIRVLFGRGHDESCF